MSDNDEAFIGIIELALDYSMVVPKKEIRKYERLIKKRTKEDKNKSKNIKDKMGTRTMPQYLYMV